MFVLKNKGKASNKVQHPLMIKTLHTRNRRDLLNLIKGIYKKTHTGFPGGAAVENPPANAQDTGSIPGPGRSHMPQSN